MGDVCPAVFSAQTTSGACAHFWATPPPWDQGAIHVARMGRAKKPSHKKKSAGREANSEDLWSRRHISKGFAGQRAYMWSARPLCSHLTGESQWSHWAGFLLTSGPQTQDYTHVLLQWPCLSEELKTEVAAEGESDPKSTHKKIPKTS